MTKEAADSPPRGPEYRRFDRWLARLGAYRKVTNVVGVVLTVGALAFVAYEIQSRAAQLSRFTDPSFLLLLAAAILACGVATVFLVAGWRLALLATSPLKMPVREAISIYGRTNVLKYLPTKVLHLAGRYALLLARGFSHRAIITSTAAEHGLLMSAALSLAIFFGLPAILQNVSGFVEDPATVVVLVATAIVMLLAVTGLIFVTGVRERSTFAAIGILMAAALAYLVYFLMLGAVAAALALTGTEPLSLDDYLTMTGIVSAAFAIGLLTPLIPAGFGVREAVIVLAMNATHLSASAITVSLGLRVATLGGDLLLGVVGLLLARGGAAALSSSGDGSPVAARPSGPDDRDAPVPEPSAPPARPSPH